GMIFSQTRLLILAVIVIIASLGHLLAIWLNRRSKIATAVYLSCGTIASSVVLITLVIPETLPTLVLTPVLIVAVALPYLDRAMLRIMSVGTIVLATTITALGIYVQLLEPITGAFLDLLNVFFVAIATAIILLLFWQNNTRLKTALQQSEQANRELRTLQASLETQVAERTRELRQALVELEERANEQARMREALEQQREVILGLSVPVLPVTDTILVMPLVGALDQRRLEDVQQRALKAIEQSNAQVLLIDITGVPVVDTQVAKGLISVVQAARLLGARAVLVGIRPEVAQALVEAGIDLRSIQTFASLQGALGGMLNHSKACTSVKYL
ncbi:MAG: STAS domain-containing protein, partial [Roseiflexaceae bacterium]|nr:STAS domain-containing protein [Roseiflexaceae bacterium]